jgi:hypothetical protein
MDYVYNNGKSAAGMDVRRGLVGRKAEIVVAILWFLLEGEGRQTVKDLCRFPEVPQLNWCCQLKGRANRLGWWRRMFN